MENFSTDNFFDKIFSNEPYCYHPFAIMEITIKFHGLIDEAILPGLLRRIFYVLCHYRAPQQG
jgi:hypothetical protein